MDERAAFLKSQNVSREALEKFDIYASMLGEWNARFNLVAKSTLPHVWARHFLDSAQLMNFIPDKKSSIADLGSGAGFPGLVLAILGMENVHLIESTGKKADFLRAVIEKLGLNTRVCQERIESIKNLKPDILTARALKPLPELLKLAKPLIKKDSICLFLKGKSIDGELTELSRWWKFTSEKHVSISDPSGSVLILRNLAPLHVPIRKRRGGHHRHKR